MYIEQKGKQPVFHCLEPNVENQHIGSDALGRNGKRAAECNRRHYAEQTQRHLYRGESAAGQRQLLIKDVDIGNRKAQQVAHLCPR